MAKHTMLILCLFTSCAAKKEVNSIHPNIYYAKDAVLKDVTVYGLDQYLFGSKEYVGNFSKDTSSVTFSIDVPVTDNYDIIISSAAAYGNGHKLNYVLVNGKQIGEIETLENNKFAESVIRYVCLEKGKNEITVKKNWGWIYGLPEHSPV